VKKARDLLNGSKTTLFTVLNKSKAYGPASLREDA
jgi:hypothetical protein